MDKRIRELLRIIGNISAFHTSDLHWGSKINQDLQIAGDDADELLFEIEKILYVDFSNFNASLHFDLNEPPAGLYAACFARLLLPPFLLPINSIAISVGRIFGRKEKILSIEMPKPLNRGVNRSIFMI